jgi:NitT/TauT family transport system permease protein
MTYVLLRRLAIFLAIVLVWQGFASAGLSSVVLPSPAQIFSAATGSFGEFVEGFKITLFEFVTAAVIASLFGVLFGALMGLTKLGVAASGPILASLFAVPLITWYPLFMTWFGLGSASKIAYGVVSGIFPIAIATLNGVSGVDQQKLVFGRSIGCSQFQLFSRIILPMALPSIVTGLRVGIALTLIGVIVAEMLSSLGGIGYVISYHRTMFNTGHVYFGIIIAVLCAYGVNRGLTALEKRFSAWRDVD